MYNLYVDTYYLITYICTAFPYMLSTCINILFTCTLSVYIYAIYMCIYILYTYEHSNYICLYTHTYILDI